MAAKRKSQDFNVLILTNDEARGYRISQQLAKIETELFSGKSIGVTLVKPGLELIRHGKPTLIVLDAEEPFIDPLHCIKQIRIVQPSIPLMLITTPCDPMLASRALRAGAIAYLSSDEVEYLMNDAIAKIAANERFVSEQVMQGILHGIVETFHSANDLPIQLLSDREMMVFQLLGQGNILRAIAAELGVNIKTISTHCNNIRRKLQTPDNQQLARISREWIAGRQANGDQPAPQLKEAIT